MKGEYFRHRILTAIKGNKEFIETILPYNATIEGAAIYADYHRWAEVNFPEYLDEIRGMAEGAKLTYSEVCQFFFLFFWRKN